MRSPVIEQVVDHIEDVTLDQLRQAHQDPGLGLSERYSPDMIHEH